MTCVHPGAYVVVDEYAERVVSDLHLIGGCVVVRVTQGGTQMMVNEPGLGDYYLTIGEGHWFDRERSASTTPYSTIITARHNLTRVPAEYADRWPTIG